MGTDIISKKEFAERCGVSPAAVSKALRGELGAALVGKKLDANHAAATKYAEGKSPKDAKPGEPKVQKVATDEKQAKAAVTGKASLNQKREDQNKLEGYYTKTLLEIVQVHGSQAQFEGWLRSAKLMEEVRDKQTKNFEREGRLVDRELVRQAVIVPYDTAHTALMHDVAKTIAARAVSMAKGGATVPEVERFVATTISKTLTRAKDKVRKALGE